MGSTDARIPIYRTGSPDASFRGSPGGVSDAEAAEAVLRGAHAPPPKKRVDSAQVDAGTLEAARRKVAHLGAQSAKRQRRAARKRDANPHFKGGGRGAARALLDGAAAKRGGKRKKK